MFEWRDCTFNIRGSRLVKRTVAEIGGHGLSQPLSIPLENVDCAVNAINPRCRADRTLGQIGFLLAVKYRLHLVLSGFLASHCASPRF